MDLLGGIFIMMVAILLVSSICLGFIVCYFITQRGRDTGREAERLTPSASNTNSEETQLGSSERNPKQDVSFSKYFLLLSLSVAVTAIGLAGIGISSQNSYLLLGIGLAGIVGAITVGILLRISSRKKRD